MRPRLSIQGTVQTDCCDWSKMFRECKAHTMWIGLHLLFVQLQLCSRKQFNKPSFIGSILVSSLRSNFLCPLPPTSRHVAMLENATHILSVLCYTHASKVTFCNMVEGVGWEWEVLKNKFSVSCRFQSKKRKILQKHLGLHAFWSTKKFNTKKYRYLCTHLVNILILTWGHSLSLINFHWYCHRSIVNQESAFITNETQRPHESYDLTVPIPAGHHKGSISIPTFSRASFSFGATFFIYGEWNATPEQLTSRTNTSCSFNLDTNCFTLSSGPEIVTVFLELWQAGTMSGGHLVKASVHVSPV